MERVAFLIEETGERLGCLLNPESLVMRRVAGVRSRLSPGGELGGTGLQDDPLLYTGGGRTELELALLFDISLAGSSLITTDVRDLTGPLWNLAENARSGVGAHRPPLVRFVWGKAWNIPGIVSAVAERLEEFSANGAPRRSWLSLRLWRVAEPRTGALSANNGLPERSFAAGALDVSPERVPADQVRVHVVSAGERLDEIAARYYPNQPAEQASSLWRLLASFNNLQDPLHLPAGFLLRIPPLSALGGAA